jgi:hypothetical protein
MLEQKTTDLSDRLFKLGCLIEACHWVADALEHATSATFLTAPPEDLLRARGVAHALSRLLEPAASHLFDLLDLEKERHHQDAAER